MTPDEKIKARIHHAIDSISESVRINGAESDTTDFLINYLSGDIDTITKLILEMECDKAADESGDAEA